MLNYKFIDQDGKEQNIRSIAQFKGLITSGQIADSTLIFNEKKRKWERAFESTDYNALATSNKHSDDQLSKPRERIGKSPKAKLPSVPAIPTQEVNDTDTNKKRVADNKTLEKTQSKTKWIVIANTGIFWPNMCVVCCSRENLKEGVSTYNRLEGSLVLILPAIKFSYSRTRYPVCKTHKSMTREFLNIGLPIKVKPTKIKVKPGIFGKKIEAFVFTFKNSDYAKAFYNANKYVIYESPLFDIDKHLIRIEEERKNRGWII